MNNFFRLITFVLVLSTGTLFLSSCGTTKNMASKSETAQKYYDAGNYNDANRLVKEIIASYENAGKDKECPVYTLAGQTALKTGDTAQALEYFKKAEYSASLNEDTYMGLATCYKHKDNLSKEMMALQDYLEKYPNGKYVSQVKKRLFAIYVESENYDKALELWPQLQDSIKKNPDYLEKYFIANRELNNEKVCDSLAPVIIDFHPNNIEVLEYQAKKYFDRAENLYGKEMKAYEKNRTNKQYNHLIKALNMVSDDFNKALKYYQKLYKLDPQPKYAKALAHIYTRLDNKAKANYYLKKSKQ